nr:sialidase family protein [Alcaligenes faecalis]
MTVSSEQSRVQYATDGVATSFPVPFRFLSAQHLRVSFAQGEDDAVELVLGRDFDAVGAGNPSGGTITTYTTYPVGGSIAIERVVPITQETAYQRNDPFPEHAHEKALDKLTMICQMLASLLGLTPGSQNRALLLGAADLDGKGSYRANGNRIQGLGDATHMLDAVNKKVLLDHLSSLATEGSGQYVVERLADVVSRDNGAGMSGFDESIQYPEKSVGSGIQNVGKRTEQLAARQPANYLQPAYSGSNGAKRSLANVTAWGESDREAAKLDASDSVFYRLPQIVKYPDGVLGIVCAELHGSYDDIGQSATQRALVVGKTSRDNGATWSGPRSVIADFGSNYQNSEVCVIYNYVDGRTYVFFTSCKGRTGWGHSQAGTTDPNLSSQIYMTWCDGYEYSNFVAPINITTQLKEPTDALIWTSPCQGVVFPSGQMGIVISTVDDTAANVASYLVLIDEHGTHKKNLIMRSPDTGGEVSVHLLPDGRLLAHSRGWTTPDSRAMQKLFVSDKDYLDWEFLSEIKTSDTKGDIALISRGIEDVPLWILANCNGPSDTGDGRSHYRVWASRNLINWNKVPVTGIHDDAIAYISAIPAGDGDGALSCSEASGYEGVWFTSYSMSFLRGMNTSLRPKGMPVALRGDAANLLVSAGIPEFQTFYNLDRNAISINVGGFEQVLRAFGTERGTTLQFNASHTELQPGARNLDVIEIASGEHELLGIIGGYVGQRVVIVSISSSAHVTLVRQSTSVPSGPDRFHFDVSGGNTRLRIQFGTQTAVVATKTAIGWVFEAKANIA